MSKNKNFQTPNADELNGKVQTTGQQGASDMSVEVKTPAPTGTEVKEITEPKAALTTKRAAEVVTAESSSSGGGAYTRSRATGYSGGAGDTKGDESATTRATRPYRGGGRSDRRADPITKHIDFLNAEVIKTHIRQSKPLYESPDGQGWNGNYFNDHAITQKGSGGAPADPLFERSIDGIEFDTLYYTLGQMVSPKMGGEKLTLPNWDQSARNGNGSFIEDVEVQLGDYLPTKLSVTLQRDGTIVGFDVTEAEISPAGVDEKQSRLAADTVRRFKNQSELDRNAMISVSSNENDPKWSGLSLAIKGATDQNRFLRLLEAMAGNIVGTCERHVNKAGAHQCVKTKKDGSRKTGPMAEMFNGCIPTMSGASKFVSESDGIYKALYSSENMLHGGAGLWLAVNDSLPKYTTKGKVLSLPLGPKSAAAVAAANADPLICDKQLFALMQKNDLYSTIDGPYDPLRPVVISDKVGLVHPIDPFVGCNWDSENNTLDTVVYTMHYENRMNKYNIKICNYFAQGLFDWFVDYGYKLADHIATCIRKEGGNWNTGTKTIEIPIVSATTTFSLWDLIVCQAVPYIVQRRLQTMTALLEYERNHGYPYSNVAHLKEIDVNAADNYTFTAIDAELSIGVAKPVAAMKVLMPEILWPVAKFQAQGENGGNGVGAYVVLPSYFVQNQFKYDQIDNSKTKKLILSEDYATMAYPSTREGTNFSFMDTIYGMSEEDYRLALDRMISYPAYEGANHENGIESKFARTRGAGTEPKFDASAYKYGLTSEGLVVLPYFAYAENALNKGYTLQVSDILSTPRELGLMQIAPAGLLTPIRTADDTENTVSVDSSYLGLSGPGFRVTIYHAKGVTVETDILGEGTYNISNNASLAGEYDKISCNRWGAHFMNGLALNATTGRAFLSPFTSGGYDPTIGDYDPDEGIYSTNEEQNTDLKMHTSQRYTFNRIQRLPFILNPFDANGDPLTTVGENMTAINDEDIFDFLYMFGLCGFRASDYSELINQRTKERIAKGMNYTIDPFVEKSMLLK